MLSYAKRVPDEESRMVGSVGLGLALLGLTGRVVSKRRDRAI